ncbi:MalY/PatB family protein [Liquorilactobacillus oeni]|uniref:cysteine-S-conjugate beta-lyase n=1 Tax=Liquorilactobacillus oeni DSM 19972 TaxID=1423777 RepID=A0A0R1MHJ1_9LACO|nr:PatB family C-S lyase [Liquorilactobacillus oeni]KRL05380.1 aminotransferase [Liquorilactobacillus oeni DSM 19972]
MELTEFVEKYAVERRQSASVKWDGMKDKFGSNDLLPLWVADTEFKVPDAVTTALQERIAHGAYGYSLTPDSYYEAYFKWQKSRYGTELERDWMRFGTGVVQSLSVLVSCLSEPGDAVMLLQPVYGPFMNVIVSNERQPVVSNLKRNGTHYEMDLADIQAKMKEKNVKLLLLCSPHNPVGRVWGSSELEDLLEICRQEKVLLISDEIHHDLIVGQRPFVSALSIKNGYYRDNVIMLDSASKTFNLAALQNSHVIIPNPQLRERYDHCIERLHDPAGSLLGKVASEAAYRHGAKWLAGMFSVIKHNYEYLKKRLTTAFPQITVYDLEGTYLAWIDLSQVIPPEKLEWVIKHRARLAVDFGEEFGPVGKGFIRVNLATTPANIEKAADALCAAIQN